MRKLSLLLLTVVLVQVTVAQIGTESVALTDMLKIKTIGNITLTKDGSRAAFTVTSIEPDPVHMGILKNNLALNQMSVVNTLEAAVSDVAGVEQKATRLGWCFLPPPE